MGKPRKLSRGAKDARLRRPHVGYVGQLTWNEYECINDFIMTDNEWRSKISVQNDFFNGCDKRMYCSIRAQVFEVKESRQYQCDEIKVSDIGLELFASADKLILNKEIA